MDLTVIIVNHNVHLFLEQCLASVRKACSGLAVEVIVIDNASEADPYLCFSAIYPEVRFLRNIRNKGFSVANNWGFRMSHGRYVLMLNPDTVVGESSFRYLCSFMDAHPDVGAAGPKMIDARGRFHAESKRGFPTPWAAFCKLFGLLRLFPKSGYDLSYLSENDPQRVDVLSGAFMFIRRSVIDKVGLLDESFFMYGEDIDLSWRIRKAGYLNYYLPLRLLHYKGESSRQNNELYLKNFYGAMQKFFRKYYPRSSRFFAWTISLGIGLIKLRSRFKRFWLGDKPQLPAVDRNVLIVGGSSSYETAKALCQEYIHGLASISLLSPAEAETIPEGITDIAFISPDLSFEDILRRIEANGKASGYRFVHHICHPAADILISPSK
jgi:GT2 family glycosyltransferase